MSFPTDPNLYTFLPDPTGCSVCFDPGKTPATQFVQFTGILTGDTWSAGDPPPPNGLFEITNPSGCFWIFDDGVTVVNLNFAALSTILFSVVVSLGVTAFFANPLLTCETELFNGFTTPGGRKYFSGSASVMNPLESGTRNNIELMALLNIQPEIRTFCNPQAIATNILSTRYSQRNGRTDVYIKYDFT